MERIYGLKSVNPSVYSLADYREIKWHVTNTLMCRNNVKKIYQNVDSNGKNANRQTKQQA